MKTWILLILAVIFAVPAVLLRGFMAFLFAVPALILLTYFILARLKNRKIAKKLRRAFTILIALSVLVIAIAEIPIIAGSRPDGEKDADYIIILGAGLDGAVPSMSLTNRLSAALTYLNAHPSCRAVLTGGQGGDEEITEAEAMRRWLAARDISGDRLIIEDQAKNTRENIELSLKLIKNGGTVAIVSNDYHLYRAKLLAKKLGVEVFCIPAITPLPLLNLCYYLREAFAVMRLWILG